MSTEFDGSDPQFLEVKQFVMSGKNWNYCRKQSKFKQFTPLKGIYIMDKSQFKIGDIVYEKHHPQRIGVVLEVYRRGLLINWKNPNPNKVRPGFQMEIIDPAYLIKVVGEELI